MIALFPGQGSQHVGMAKDLFDNFRLAQELFEEASDAAKVNLKKLCFDGPEADLTATENAQPALLLASTCALRIAEKETGFQATLTAGHSLGEYSALVATGAIPFATAIRWVRERGLAMQKAVPRGEGSMTAVLNMEDALVEKMCAEATRLAAAKRPSSDYQHLSVAPLVAPANFNAPGQIVISGSVDALAEATALMKTPEFSGKAIPLQVSAPFHCALMKPSRDRMADVFAKTPDAEKPHALKCPYIPNRTARITTEASLVLDFLVEQIDHPVLWKQSMENLLQAHEGPELKAVEFGPGKVLQGLAKRIAKNAGKTFQVESVGDTAGIKNLMALGANA
ncbi:MAG: ACP S-malonyltransferase [Bacteriovoracia bacterium]